MQMAYDCGLIINTVHFLYTMILASISINDKGDDGDRIMTPCLKIVDARASFLVGKMKS